MSSTSGNFSTFNNVVYSNDPAKPNNLFVSFATSFTAETLTVTTTNTFKYSVIDNVTGVQLTAGEFQIGGFTQGTKNLGFSKLFNMTGQLSIPTQIGIKINVFNDLGVKFASGGFNADFSGTPLPPAPIPDMRAVALSFGTDFKLDNNILSGTLRAVKTEFWDSFFNDTEMTLHIDLIHTATGELIFGQDNRFTFGTASFFNKSISIPVTNTDIEAKINLLDTTTFSAFALQVIQTFQQPTEPPITEGDNVRIIIGFLGSTDTLTVTLSQSDFTVLQSFGATEWFINSFEPTTLLASTLEKVLADIALITSGTTPPPPPPEPLPLEINVTGIDYRRLTSTSEQGQVTSTMDIVNPTSQLGREVRYILNVKDDLTALDLGQTERVVLIGEQFNNRSMGVTVGDFLGHPRVKATWQIIDPITFATLATFQQVLTHDELPPVEPPPEPIGQTFRQEFIQADYINSSVGKSILVKVSVTRLLQNGINNIVGILQIKNQAGQVIHSIELPTTVTNDVFDLAYGLGDLPNATATITFEHFIQDMNQLGLAEPISVLRTIVNEGEPPPPIIKKESPNIMTKLIGALAGITAIALLASRGK